MTNFDYAVISDIHLGHPRTPTQHVIDNLRRFIINPATFSKIDYLFVTGDTFDRLLQLPSDCVTSIHVLFSELLQLAKEYSVVVVVLEGTPFHDRRQSKLLVTINKNFGAELHYVDDINVLKIRDLVFGFVPDEIRPTTDIALRDFKECLATKGYSKVDFLLMHGLFDFHNPGDGHEFSYADWSALVNYAIYIGHDHNPKSKHPVYIPGSFESTVHGEVGERGYIYGNVTDGVVTHKRIVNTNAFKYTTVDGVLLDDAELITAVESVLTQPDGHIRVIMSATSALRPLVKEWRAKTTAQLEVSFITPASTAASIDNEFTEAAPTINITKENIANQIINALPLDLPVPVELITREIENIQNTVKG